MNDTNISDDWAELMAKAKLSGEWARFLEENDFEPQAYLTIQALVGRGVPWEEAFELVFEASGDYRRISEVVWWVERRADCSEPISNPTLFLIKNILCCLKDTNPNRYIPRPIGAGENDRK